MKLTIIYTTLFIICLISVGLIITFGEYTKKETKCFDANYNEIKNLTCNKKVINSNPLGLIILIASLVFAILAFESAINKRGK
jgi:hypothetical protein